MHEGGGLVDILPAPTIELSGSCSSATGGFDRPQLYLDTVANALFYRSVNRTPTAILHFGEIGQTVADHLGALIGRYL
jgi:hypothetical protein